MNSQFEVSYDPYHNVLCWDFSPDCVGSSLKRYTSCEDKLDMNGALMVFNLDDIPQTKFIPPPTFLHTPYSNCHNQRVAESQHYFVLLPGDYLQYCESQTQYLYFVLSMKSNSQFVLLLNVLLILFCAVIR